MKQLGVDYVDYWGRFETMYDEAVHAAFQGPDPLARFRIDLIYYSNILVAAATAGYEVEVSPAEAVGLMVILEAYVFTKKHGSVARLLKRSVRERASDHESMLKAVSPQIGHLRQQPIIDAFADRMSHHLRQLP